MSQYNIFLATPKGYSDSARDEAMQAVNLAFCKALPSSKISISESKDVFEDSFAKLGGWDEWTTHVATGVDYQDRTPLFNAIVCVDKEVGKATSDIVRKALESRRMVAVLDGKGSLERVTSVSCVDSDNWQTGWRLDTMQ